MNLNLRPDSSLSYATLLDFTAVELVLTYIDLIQGESMASALLWVPLLLLPEVWLVLGMWN